MKSGIHAICAGILTLFVMATMSLNATDYGNTSVTKYGDVLEWSAENASYSGNPFDVVVTVRYTHTSTGTVRELAAFYDGDTSWRWRFWPELEGEWTFTTTADGSNGTTNDPELHGHTGSITVTSALTSDAKGLVYADGTQFALQRADRDDAFLLNIYEMGYGREAPEYCLTRMDYFTESNVNTRYQEHIDLCKEAGMNTLQIFMSEVGGVWHHSSTGNPNLTTFELLDTMFAMNRAQDIRVHFWQWGDGGAHAPEGDALVRLTRYIGARLGPQPRWTMSYGYDGIPSSLASNWAITHREACGWPHLLWGRGWSHTELDALANDDRKEVASDPYGHALNLIQNSDGRPIVYERRWWVDRDGFTGPKTIQAMWEFAMAGGAASWWGERSDNGDYYTADEKTQLQTHLTFWHTKRRFLRGMVPVDLGDAYCLALGSSNYVAYRRDADSITIDLSGAADSLEAIAVDTSATYSEIDLGTLSPENQTINLPHVSHWALGIGDFSTSSLGDPPEITSGPSVADDPVTSTATTASVTATDPDGNDADITYSWSTVAKPSGAAVAEFSPNNSKTAKNTSVTFFAAGDYTLEVRAIDTDGNLVSATVSLTVEQVASQVDVTPSSEVILEAGEQRSFSGAVLDQFGHPLASPPTISWTATGGTVSPETGSSTTYTAGSTLGSYQIQGSAGSLTGSTNTQIADLSTLWHEDFDLVDGTQVDTGATAWTTEPADNVFEVQSQRFHANDTNKQAVWRSESIDISSADNIFFKATLEGTGGLDTTDYVELRYILDGGDEMQLARRERAFSAHTFESPVLQGSSLQIVIRADNSSGNEHYYWDDIIVLGINGEFVTPGTLDLSAITASVNEDAGTVTLSVSRTGGSAGAASVDFSTTDGTATEGSDYTAADSTLSWADGDSAAKEIVIDITDDADDEPNETFTITLSNASGASLGDDKVATVTIIDNDVAVMPGTITLPVTAADANEGDSISVTIERNGFSDGEVSVYYETTHIDTDNGDYTAASGTLTWADGNADDKTVVIDITDDSDSEDAEDFKVVLSSPTGGATIGNDTETITILANDAVAGAIGLSAATASVDENGGSITLTVNRIGGSDGAVSVDFATADDTATAGADYSSESGTLSWADGNSDDQTLVISISDDSDYEGEETFTLTLSGITGGAVYATQETVVTIVEDDTEPNNPPVITDGPNADPTTVMLPNGITLDVTATDADGDTLSYAWSKMFGPGNVSFTAQAASTTATFNAAGSYTIEVLVSDGNGGSVSGTVDVTVNEAPTTDDGDIVVTGNTDFGATYVEDGSSVRTFTIRNDGTGVLLIENVTLGGTDAAAFSITAASALSLAAGGSTAVEVTFDPSSEGSKTATLTVVSDDPTDGTVVLDLTGEALAGSTPALPPPSDDDDGCNVGFGSSGSLLGILLALLVVLKQRIQFNRWHNG